MQPFESTDNRKPNNHLWGFADMPTVGPLLNRHRWRRTFLKQMSFFLPNYSAITSMNIARKSSHDSQKRQSKIAEEKENNAQVHHGLIEEIPKNPSAERPCRESDQRPRL